MPIFRAIGLGIFLIVLQLIVPSIFAQFEKTTIAFLHAGELGADSAGILAGSASSIPRISNEPLILPKARDITPMP